MRDARLKFNHCEPFGMPEIARQLDAAQPTRRIMRRELQAASGPVVWLSFCHLSGRGQTSIKSAQANRIAPNYLCLSRLEK